MTMTAIKIARLNETDWQALRAIRLRALQSDPGVFGSNHAKESGYDEAKWRAWLTDPDTAVFAVLDGDAIVGMTGIAIDRDDPSRRSAILWGSWLAPPYRGQGLSVSMYDARTAWARRHETCEVVVVSHRASNTASQKANRKHGFVFTHAAPQLWPDGVTEDRLFYKLTL